MSSKGILDLVTNFLKDSKTSSKESSELYECLILKTFQSIQSFIDKLNALFLSTMFWMKGRTKLSATTRRYARRWSSWRRSTRTSTSSSGLRICRWTRRWGACWLTSVTWRSR